MLSVDEFDYLTAFLAQNPHMTFGSVFAQVKEFEADPGRSSFFFQDHLKRIAGAAIPRPEHLWEKMAAVINEITEKMRRYEQERKTLQ